MKKRIQKSFDKWTYRLGLGWWRIEVYYYQSKKEVKRFKKAGSENAYARVYPDWRYGAAVICVCLPAFKGLTDKEIEEIVVHELVHILVNETQAGGMDHEERVVTGLTKAFFWAAEGL